jgi:CBS domain containing-hemolysin-like protein
MITPILIITLLILLNGVFVAAEFAIVGAPRPAIERRAAAGDRRARMVAAILRSPREQDRFIATAQLGITVASLGLGMYGEHLLAGWIGARLEPWLNYPWLAAHTVASVLAIGVLTYFHIVIGEMVPKSMALQRAETTVLWIAPAMRVVQWITFPFVLLLNGIGNGLLRALGVRRDVVHAEQYRTPEELAYLVQEARAGGLLRSEPARVVAELIEFGHLTAGEIMVPRVRVAAIPLGAGEDDIRTLLREEPHTRYPVYDGTVDHIVGMMHLKDILRCLPQCGAIESSHVRPVPFVPATAGVDHVMAAMRQTRAQMAVVLDEHGGTAGIVTTEDLFEEVVGDVGDDRPEVSRLPDGRVRALGITRIDVLGEQFGMELEHPDVDTLSGLVLALLNRPPLVGDRVSWQGIAVEVTAVEGHGVEEVLATPEPGALG